ncbi:MAG: hypothetical protein ACP5N3_01870 [Candidatus Nanoarchaeia archaeon]
MKKAQIALEFLLLTGFMFIMFFVFLFIVLNLSERNNDEQKILALEDLGSSLKNEFVLASEMENGFHREINLPAKIRGNAYSINIAGTDDNYSYLVLASENYEILYSIPKTTGTILPGKNLIKKNDNLTVEQI